MAERDKGGKNYSLEKKSKRGAYSYNFFKRRNAMV